MRSVFLVLFLANLALFGFAQGWFGQTPSGHGRDPSKLAHQLRPETIQVSPLAKTDE